MTTVSRTYEADFGPRYSGLAGTIGYALPGLPRQTAGVVEVAGKPGYYQVTVSHDAALTGTIVWDTGTIPVKTAEEEIYPTEIVTPGISDATLADAFTAPQQVQSDAGTVTSRPLPDLIAAHKYLAGLAAATSKTRGLRFNQLVPGGTVGRSTIGIHDPITPNTYDKP